MNDPRLAEVQSRLRRIRSFQAMLDVEVQELESLLASEADIDFDKGERWVSTAEVARKTGFDPSTITRKAVKGEIVARRIGGRWKYPKSKVDDLSLFCECPEVSG